MLTLATLSSLANLAAIATATVDSPHSRRCYARALRAFLGWCGAEGRSFDRAAVQDYRAMRLQMGASCSTVSQELSAIRTLARESAARGLLAHGALAGILAVPGVRREGRRAGSWLSAGDAKRLMAAPSSCTLDGLRDRALLGLLLGAGLRRAECAGLRVGMLVERSGRPVLLDLVRKRGRIQTVPIPVWADGRLRAWFAAANITEGPAFRPIVRRILQLSALTPAGVWWIVRRWARSCNLDIRPHDLRRTCAALALDAGADLREIQVQLGHASVTTTELYLRQITDLRGAACDRILE